MVFFARHGIKRIPTSAVFPVVTISSTPFGSALDERELRALSAQGVVKTYPKNTVVVSEGDDTDAFFILVSGRVKVYVSDDEGREVMLRALSPGEYFGEMTLDGHPRSASVMTLEPARLIAIPKAKFRDFVGGHPDFAIHLIEQLIGRVRALTENVKSLALMDVYGRVARFMLDMAQPENGKLVIQEKLTQQDIASRVGASREMISKIFKELVTGGYISINRKRITINKTPPRHW
jgi:CRP/FNR family transcriptional regulator, cyclic AMP receptor protein